MCRLYVGEMKKKESVEVGTNCQAKAPPEAVIPLFGPQSRCLIVRIDALCLSKSRALCNYMSTSGGT